MTTATTLTNSDFNNTPNAINYAIAQKMLQLNTIALCIVQSYNPINRTCVINNLLTTLNINASPSQPVTQYNVPIADIAGNGAGVEIEYAEGDIVLVGYCNRDISNIINYLQQSNNITASQTFNPNSYRTFNLSDGIILCRVSFHAPDIKVKITSEGIDIIAGSKPVNINAQTVNINGELIINGQPYIQHKHSAGTYNLATQPVTGESGVKV